MNLDLNLPWPIEPHETWNIIDATKLKTWQECPRKYLLEYIFGWRLDSANHDLIFGTSWHDFMEFMLIHNFEIMALEEGHKVFLDTYRQSFGELTDDDYDPKSPGNALQAMKDYMKQFEHDNLSLVWIDWKGKQKPLTEISGCVPLTPDGRFVVYFKIDAIVRDRYYKEAIRGLEHKTTKAEYKWYDAQWVLKQQPHLYTHALHYLFRNVHPVQGITINATFFRKKGNTTHRIPVDRNAHNMQSWMWQTIHLMEQIEWNMEQLLKHNSQDAVLRAFPQNPESCTNYNRLCQFHDFCRMGSAGSNPLKLHKQGVPLGFTTYRWNPTIRDDEKERKWKVGFDPDKPTKVNLKPTEE